MVRIYDIPVEALVSRPPPRASESFNSSIIEHYDVFCTNKTAEQKKWQHSQQ